MQDINAPRDRSTEICSAACEEQYLHCDMMLLVVVLSAYLTSPQCLIIAGYAHASNQARSGVVSVRNLSMLI
jgi:hypothetical protein